MQCDLVDKYRHSHHMELVVRPRPSTKLNLTDEEQWRLLSVVREFMEIINWAPASKLENGELAIPLSYLAKAANEASTLLKTIGPEEREN